MKLASLYAELCSSDQRPHTAATQEIVGLKDYFFFPFLPLDFLPPVDLAGDDFLEPLPDFFAVEDLPFPLFLAFSVGGLPPPDGAVPPEEG
jgi:hypothetical protein